MKGFAILCDELTKYDRQLVTINHVRGHNFQNLTNCNITLSISNAFVTSLFFCFPLSFETLKLYFLKLTFFLFLFFKFIVICLDLKQ